MALNCRLIKLLKELGLPSHLKGYVYIKDAVLFLHNEEETSYNKDIYKHLEKKHNKNYKSIERAIRTAIDLSFKRGNLILLENIFGYSINRETAKPTNLEFIYVIREVLIEDYHIFLNGHT